MGILDYVKSIQGKESPSGKPFGQVTIEVPSKKAILYTVPSPEILAHLKQTRFEGRKSWSVEGLTFIPSGHNINILHEYFDLTIKDPFVNLADMEDELHKEDEYIEYIPHTKPYEFQEQASDLMRSAPKNGRNFALFCEPGTGKSKMAIDRACELFVNNYIKTVIIIAPKGVHRQWVEEQLTIHCGIKYKAYTWEGSLKPPKFRPRPKDTLVFFCLNYDAMRGKVCRRTFNEFLDIYDENFMVILDESHLVKNKSSIRWKNCDKLISHMNCYSKLLLTGTPIAKNLLDEWAQFFLLDPNIIGIEHATTFRNEYCVMGGKNGTTVIGTRNLEHFKALTDKYIFRARKSELAGMPEKVYKRWSFNLASDQRARYQKMAVELILYLEEKKKEITAANAAVKMLKLQQITNGFLIDSEGKTEWIVDPYENPRMIELQNILDEDIPLDEKVIIWCRFKQDIFYLRKFIPYSIVFHGGLKDHEKKRNLELWIDKNNRKRRIFIATPGSGGTGLNLQKSGCKYAIYYSNSENSIHRWQSEDRIHRIGADATQPVIYYDLVARCTRDLDILANLRMKKNISDMTLDDIITSIKGVL